MAANPLLGGLDTGDYADNSINRAATAGMSAPSRGGRFAPANPGATSGVAADTASRVQADRDDVDRREAALSFPHLTPPPPQEAVTDPFQAFGQPAMWIAALGSLFTRRPLVNAINAAGAVLQSTHEQDTAAAKRHYETWKVEQENALKLAKFEQDAYKLAIQKMHTDATVGEAMIRTHIAGFKDDVLNTALQHGGMEEVKKLLFMRGKSAASADSSSGALDTFLKGHVDQADAATLLASDNREDVAKGVVLMAEARAKIIGGTKGEGTAKADAYSAVVNAKRLAKMLDNPDDKVAQGAWDELASSGYTHGTMKPYKPAAEGSRTADHAKMDADIRQAHPDWSDSQVIAERTKQEGLGKSLLSGDALDNAVAFYKRTGKFPFTARSKEDQDVVLNAIGKNDRGSGTPESRTGELLENQATLQADERSLNQITKQRDAAQGYERGARAELHLARDNIPKTPEPLNSQLLTQWVRTGDRSFGGVPTAKYMTYLVSGLDEYAKVLSGGTGSAAASTDGSRKQALELIPPGATTDQIKGIMDALDDGMAVKIKGYNDQIAATRGRVRDGAQAPVRLTTGHEDEDYAVLPSGTKFYDPHGQIRTKP